MRNASDGVANLVFGGAGHTPVLDGGSCGHSRANSLAGRVPAGADVAQQTAHRRSAEMNLERKQRAPARSITDQYDAYLDASEEHTFSKLRANLQKMERKAEREHNFMKDAAGMSVERRNERADAKVDGRREKARASTAEGMKVVCVVRLSHSVLTLASRAMCSRPRASPAATLHACTTQQAAIRSHH